jgi:oxalate decarboxylase/phosphoglucose isomerase-like protein (cupin superfamily)
MPLPMTEEQINQSRLHRASRVREVVENEEFQSAFEAIEQELTEAWKTSPQRDADGREKLFLALTMLHKVKSALEQTMQSGQIALMNLRHQNPTTREQARDFLGMESFK